MFQSESILLCPSVLLVWKPLSLTYTSDLDNPLDSCFYGLSFESSLARIVQVIKTHIFEKKRRSYIIAKVTDNHKLQYSMNYTDVHFHTLKTFNGKYEH